MKYYEIDEDRIQRLKERAIKRSGKIYLIPGLRCWRDAITVEGDDLLFWYDAVVSSVNDGSEVRLLNTFTLVEPLKEGPPF